MSRFRDYAHTRIPSSIEYRQRLRDRAAAESRPGLDPTPVESTVVPETSPEPPPVARDVTVPTAPSAPPGPPAAKTKSGKRIDLTHKPS